MVNIGRASSGCGLCRKRRVKCDEGKPSCLRCLKVGRDCPGYRDTTSTRFRYVEFIELPKLESSGLEVNNAKLTDPFTRSASSIVRESAALINDDDIEVGQDDYLQMPSNTQLQGRSFVTHHILDFGRPWSDVTPALSYDLDHQSICCFLQMTVGNIAAKYKPPYPGFLPEMYVGAEPGSCLRLAFTATANLNMANRLGPSPHWTSQAIVDYGKAIKAINRALQDPVERLSDDTLISVWLLCLYEAISGFSPYFRGKSHGYTQMDWRDWHSHVRGVLTLLKMRGTDQFSRPRGRQLFQVVHGVVQWTCVVHGIEEPEELSTLVDYLYDLDSFSSVTYIHVVHFYRDITKLRAKMQRIVGATLISCQSKDITDFLRDAEMLECKMQAWDDAWPFKAVLKSSSPDQQQNFSTSNTPLAMNTYYSLWAYYQYMRFHTARFLLNDALIEVLLSCQRDDDLVSSKPLFGTHVGIRISHHKSILEESANSMIGSFAYGIGDIDMYGCRRVPPGKFEDSKAPIGTIIAGEINVVAAFQMLKPFVFIALSEHTTHEQKQNTALALGRLEGEFRGMI